MFQNPNQPTKEFLDAQVKAMQALVSHEAAQAAVEWVRAGQTPVQPRPEGTRGPLCEHRLAAIVLAKWEKQHGAATALRLIQALLSYGGDVRLCVRTHFSYRFGQPQTATLLAYFVDGRWCELPAPQQQPFDYFAYQRLLDERGWYIPSTVDRKVYIKGMKDVTWFLAPRGAVEQAETSFADDLWAPAPA